MFISATAGQIYNSVIFGQRKVNRGLESFKMSKEDFSTLGTQILHHLDEDRYSSFQLILQLIQRGHIELMELNAFLLLEEISILIEEMKNPLAVVPLKQIYQALKQQAYTTCHIFVQQV